MSTITVPRAVLEQALEALVARGKRGDGSPDTVAALRAALAQQEDIAQNLQSRLNAALLLEERRQEVAQPHRETEQEPTVRIKCTVVDNQNPNGVPFEQWVPKPLAGMSEMNRTIAYCAAAKLRELGYEWNGQAWAALAQQEQDQMLECAYKSACDIVEEQDKKLAELEAVNRELLEASKLVLPTLERLKFQYADCAYGDNFVQSRADTSRKNYDVVRAAIAKAEGQA
jgi:hypothetical protein